MSEVITMRELIAYYAQQHDISQRQARREIFRFAQTAMSLIVNEHVGFRMSEFGTFKIKKRAAREYKLPDGSGETKYIPEHEALLFQPNYLIKDHLKNLETNE